MQVQAYLNFDGRCEEALEFYRKALGAEVVMQMRLKESLSNLLQMVRRARKIKLRCVSTGDSTIMASDCHNSGKQCSSVRLAAG
jgi:PhnB protein